MVSVGRRITVVDTMFAWGKSGTIFTLDSVVVCVGVSAEFNSCGGQAARACV